MKIVYTRPLIEQMLDAIKDATERDIGIEKFVINEIEHLRLKAEVASSGMWRDLFQPYAPDTFVGEVYGVPVFTEAE